MPNMLLDEESEDSQEETEESEETSEEDQTEEETLGEELDKKVLDILSKYLVDVEVPGGDDTGEEKEDKPDDKDKKKKVLPHVHTIKYAESLKKQFGKNYVKEWDSVPINERIKKMETILEYNKNQTSDPGKDKKKVPKGGKPPTGNVKAKVNTVRGINYAAIAKKLNER